jgi:hypothetical protein
MLLYEFGDTDTLTRLLKQALFAPAAQQLQHWGAVFQSEAEANLERWRKILGIS